MVRIRRRLILFYAFLAGRSRTPAPTAWTVSSCIVGADALIGPQSCDLAQVYGDAKTSLLFRRGGACPSRAGENDVFPPRPGECVNRHSTAGRGKPRPYGVDGRFSVIRMFPMGLHFGLIRGSTPAVLLFYTFFTAPFSVQPVIVL